MFAMDLHWRAARMRKWIELGERERLTQRELSKRAGVCQKTIARWSKAVSERPSSISCSSGDPLEPPSSDWEALRSEQSFVEFSESEARAKGQIQVLLSRNRRIVIDGAVDVEALVRVITAVERC